MSKVASTGGLRKDVLQAMNLSGGFEKIIGKGDDVLLKPNYNSVDPPTASSDPEVPRVLVDLLFGHGANKVIVGESSWQMASSAK